MAAIVVFSMMAATGLFGYYLGRRSASQTLTWRQRTRRPVLARQALGLLALVVASQLQRNATQRFTSRRG